MVPTLGGATATSADGSSMGPCCGLSPSFGARGMMPSPSLNNRNQEGGGRRRRRKKKSILNANVSTSKKEVAGRSLPHGALRSLVTSN